MEYQLEYRHIRYFLAVADDLHFRKAAERLYISQPGLSRQIKELEQHLGVVLFKRNNRKVALTDAGLYLQASLQKNSNELNKIINHAKLIHQGIQGNLSFGYVGSAMQEVIPSILRSFKEQASDIVFNLKEMGNQQQIQSILSNNIDVGFVRLDRIPKTLVAIPVQTEHFCLVLPDYHTINEENFKSLRQVKEESFILFDRAYSPSYYEKVLQIFDESGFTPQISHNTIHASSIYSLVENGLGLSIVPKSLSKGYNKKVKFIELAKSKQRTTLFAIWNKENTNPALQVLIKSLK